MAPHSSAPLPRRRVLTGATLAAAGLATGDLLRSPAVAGAGTPALTPTVKWVALTGVDPDAARRLSAGDLDDVAILSPVVPSTGYATVGVTWAPGSSVAGREFFVRSQSGRDWSRWQPMPTGEGHGPTPGSAEAHQAIPGTDPVAVGDVDAVQVKVTEAAGRRLPADLTLSVIDPGRPSAAQRAAERRSPSYRPTNGSDTVTPRPGIYSRAQWGADERMRNGFAGYGKIRVAFAHHTVNANAYTRAEVPSIMRGIYAYHTQSLGWSDVGYNFLVDRFGRVWEGRWGGIGQPIIGAHTYGYNEDSFAMSAIGNFELVRPARPMLRAYGRLFAWKLSREGIDASSRVTVDGLALHAINGHRDAGSTACPGRYLYEKLPRIRRRATRLQDALSGS
ncbi:MAG: N-acetylmuramoyl-L-alanine amidase [Actinomycetota bacterium]|nr:N-acetylmuramoyl-L-alanine amidase [Actinomycetota bacterium]